MTVDAVPPMFCTAMPGTMVDVAPGRVTDASVQKR